MPFGAPENDGRRLGGEVVTDLLHLLKEMENYIRCLVSALTPVN